MYPRTTRTYSIYYFSCSIAVARVCKVTMFVDGASTPKYAVQQQNSVSMGLIIFSRFSFYTIEAAIWPYY